MKKFAILLALVAISAASFAQNPVGAWKGNISIDASTLPKARTPEEQKQMDAAMAAMRSLVLKLNVKANKTFTIDSPAMGQAPAQKVEGTWSQKGNKVTLVTTKQNGVKPPAGNKPQVLTISADSKKMTLTPATGGPKVVVTFSK